VGAAAVYIWLEGRIREPSEMAAAAVEAVAAARQADAATWAPGQLGIAESTLRASLAEQRRQAVRLFLLRSYEEARRGFVLAQSQAYEAAVSAGRERVAAEEEAAALLGRASRAVETASRLGRDIRLDRAGRRQLLQSQSALAQAEFQLRQGDPRQAQELANRALVSAQQAAGQATDLAARFVDEEQVQTWRRWIDETIAASRRSGGAAIIVVKEKHLLTLYVGGRAVRSYEADMGQNTLNDKLRAGDQATPEGRYFITVKKGPRQSRYHRALGLDYPNVADLRRFDAARRAGQITGAVGPGRLIEIHGEGGRGWDWTDGCIALSNVDVDDLFARVQVGTPVTIVGGDGGGGMFSEALRTAGDRDPIP
jgi:L,D-peptidoglycan transpeptidase YkuD (ErfK/YbiS/YcfS/YnhG family)